MPHVNANVSPESVNWSRAGGGTLDVVLDHPSHTKSVPVSTAQDATVTVTVTPHTGSGKANPVVQVVTPDDSVNWSRSGEGPGRCSVNWSRPGQPQENAGWDIAATDSVVINVSVYTAND